MQINKLSYGGGKTSETVTENLFRDFYGANTFIEKSSIPDKYGFVSKVRLIKVIQISFLITAIM